MKLTIIHLWVLACIAYGSAIFMAFQGELVASIILAMTCLLLLISTRWISSNGETKAHPS